MLLRNARGEKRTHAPQAAQGIEENEEGWEEPTGGSTKVTLPESVLPRMP